MNSKDNSRSFALIEADIYKELYKNTPLKKRPIQPSSLSPDEKKITPNAPRTRACTVPERRLSKRKMLKPLKKFIDSYVVGAPVVHHPEQATKAMSVPVIKTSTESKTSSPVEMNNNAVNMAMATPELKVTPVKRAPRISLAIWIRNLPEKERQDFYMAIELYKKDFNLRARRKVIYPPDFAVRIHRRRRQVRVEATSRGMRIQRRRRQVKTEVTSTEMRIQRRRRQVKTEVTSTESMDTNSIPSQEKNDEIGGKKPKKETKRMPKPAAETIRKNNKDAFSGSHVYILSPELANIVGHETMPAGTIMDAMHYVFLERNLFDAEKKYVTCDDELSEKIFAGKRRLRFDDVKNYLHKHLTPTD